MVHSKYEKMGLLLLMSCLYFSGEELWLWVRNM